MRFAGPQSIGLKRIECTTYYCSELVDGQSLRLTPITVSGEGNEPTTLVKFVALRVR